MLSPWSTWASFGLLILGVKGSFDNELDDHDPHSSHFNDTIIVHETCTSKLTVYDTTTIISPTTVPVSHFVDVTVPHYVNITISSTETSTVSTCITESTTTTLYYTVSLTSTDSETTTDTTGTTATLHYTISLTETDSATITNTQTTTDTVPATITTYTTQTIFSTTYNPCPTTCSISVETVNLFFWPTNRPYTYPPTYVDTALGYTFTSPSVYMFIPTAKGTNSLGQPYGPATTDWMLPLDLDEVSTIFDGSITRQLTLADLGTDCPQTADPSAIATMVDSRCDPVLAAPKQVSSWAYPCNACGRFGLFDPPYAVPTLTGGLIGTTTTTPTPAPVTTTTAPTGTSTTPEGDLLVVYYRDGTPIATSTILTTGITGTVTSSVAVSSTSTTSPSTTTPTSSSYSTTPVASSSITPSTSPSSLPATSTSTSPTSVATAPAARVMSGFTWVISNIFVAMFLL